MKMSGKGITSCDWGQHNGIPVLLFRIENASGAYVELTNYGATVVSVFVPDGCGELSNVVLGFRALREYQADKCYIGSTIGRFANRISRARFKLGGVEYRLEANDGQNSNHSGSAGFHTKMFASTVLADGVCFSLFSPNGEGGFPGNLELKVFYRWTDANELLITYQSVSDQNTIVNFTNHTYFNLSGDDDKILDHQLTVFANGVLEIDGVYIPTGLIEPAGKLAFKNSMISGKMMSDGGRLTGINHCYVLQKERKKFLKAAAQLIEAKSKRKLEVFTTYPSMIVYTADQLNSKYPGHKNRPYEPFDGLCLECQYCPDSPNHDNFPSTVMKAGKVYEDKIVYRFSNIL